MRQARRGLLVGGGCLGTAQRHAVAQHPPQSLKLMESPCGSVVGHGKGPDRDHEENPLDQTYLWPAPESLCQLPQRIRERRLV